MERRNILAGLAASALIGASKSYSETLENSILELTCWRLHNSAEDQGKRVAAYLEQGLAPALERAGSKLEGAFSNVFGEGGPYYLTVAQFASMAALGDALNKLRVDDGHIAALKTLSSGSGAPFVRADSSVLRSFDVMPHIASGDTAASSPRGSRIFELRTYQAPSFPALARKVKMFNDAEAKIFERLGMRPVFFGETLIGPLQPNLTYMLSYDDMAARDLLWQHFVSDPEWKKLSSIPELKDAEIVSNISNVVLRPMSFSRIR